MSDAVGRPLYPGFSCLHDSNTVVQEDDDNMNYSAGEEDETAGMDD